MEFYEAYWNRSECEQKLRREVIDTNIKIKLRDTLALIFPVDTIKNKRYATKYPYYMKWSFDAAKDLRIEGIVTRKFDKGSLSNPFIGYKITKMNIDVTWLLTKEVAIGDTIELP